MVRVAVIDDYQAVASSMADWSQLSPGAQVEFFHDHLVTRDAIVERLAPFDVICAMRERTAFPREVLAALPNLRLLVTSGQRNAAIDVRAATEYGVVVCGTGGEAHGTPELTWALVLAAARRVPQEDGWLRQGRWQHSVGMHLHGRTLGIVGLGRLGGIVAGYGQAFGMEVIAWSQNLTDEQAAGVGVARVDKEELFRRSDVVSVHVVLSERSTGLVGERELELMKPTALLVNTSRGPVVDESALVRALQTGQIAGAGLDVYSQEPLPSDNPILTAPNTVLTPHLGYVTDATLQRFYGDMVEDIRAWLSGSPIRVIASG